jgi:ATP-binding cassette subfamily B multidrug efflux pump
LLLDGRPLEAIPVAVRTARTGYLPQDPYLFSGTVRDNILLGSATPCQGLNHAPDATKGRPVLESAVSCAALAEDLRTFPAGLETEIGELGIRVSCGQRQRMALARAIVASGRLAPGLLVLDDPFSALDLDTEAKIVASLRQLFGSLQPYERQCTVMLFSHRLLAFPQADLVVVLDRGRILERGTHTELSEGNGLYARIYRAQRLASMG